MRILKYALPEPGIEIEMRLPQGQFAHFAVDQNNPYKTLALWWNAYEESKLDTYRVLVAPTGYDVGGYSDFVFMASTVDQDFVWHLFINRI